MGYYSSGINGQITALSAGRINAIVYAPLDKGTVEFEPNYTFSSYNQSWDEEGLLTNYFRSNDSLQIDGMISFRMAYGIADRWEIASFIASEASNFSTKYMLYDTDSFGFGLMTGLALPYGIAAINKSNRQRDQLTSFVIGGMFSVELSERTFLDMNIHYQDFFSRGDNSVSQEWYYFIDIGHYIGGIQMMSGISYQSSQSLIKWSYFPGVALEMKENFHFMVNGQFDFSGKNSIKTSGFTMAWTIIL